jgi:AbrB family looped-hinge helix DNA binding protein
MEPKPSSKGQVILPKAIRDARGWVERTRFTVEELPEAVLLRPLRPFAPTRLEDVFGCACITRDSQRHCGRWRRPLA